MLIALALAASYVVGSIDFAVVVARMHGIDIHEVGSGNPGASNVLRSVGRLPAAMVMMGDMLKGVVAAAMGMVASGVPDPAIHWAFACGLAAVLGHCYPIFHRFRGGKGVATAFGVLVFTLPLVALGSLLAWAALAAATRTASVASLVVVPLSIPAALWRGVEQAGLAWLAAIVVLVIWRHRANISRMFRGEEERITT